MREIRAKAPAYSVLGLCIASLLLDACGSSQQQPSPAAPPPAPLMTAAPAPAASVAPVTEVPAEPAPAAASKTKVEHLMHHPAVAMLLAEVTQVGLRPEQQAAVDAIRADLEKHSDTMKEPRAQLSSDLAEGVASGKLDKAKIESDSKKLAQAAESTAKSVQDAANKLHETLDASQRKMLVERLRQKAEQMQEHATSPMHGHAGGGQGKDRKGDIPAASDPQRGPASNGDKGAPAVGAQGQAAMSPHAQTQATRPGEGGHAIRMDHHGAGPHGMGHPMHSGIGRLSDILELTQDQRQKLRAKSETLMKSQMGAMKNVHANMQKRMKGISEAFMADKFDAKKSGVAEKHGEMVKSMVKARVEFVEMVLSVLGPEQRAKFAEHIRQHCEVCDEMR